MRPTAKHTKIRYAVWGTFACLILFGLFDVSLSLKRTLTRADRLGISKTAVLKFLFIPGSPLPKE